MTNKPAATSDGKGSRYHSRPTFNKPAFLFAKTRRSSTGTKAAGIASDIERQISSLQSSARDTKCGGEALIYMRLRHKVYGARALRIIAETYVRIYYMY